MSMPQTPRFHLGVDTLTTERLVTLARTPNPPVAVTPQAWQRLDGFRAHVDAVLTQGNTVYGINTGFGFLSDVAIPPVDLAQLQLNLVRSHACGVGDYSADEVVRALLILRAHSFLLGFSGVRAEVVRQVLLFLEHDILPVVPCQGSVGASGDLAPLAQLALGLLGEGEVKWRGETLPAARVLDQLGIAPLKLAPKEGLSLINGTQYMTTLAAFAVEEAKTLARSADIAAGLSLDAVRGTVAAYDARIHAARPHRGQKLVAANMLRLFAQTDSIMESHAHCGKVQDPYSFRCVPQVHGASRDTIAYCESVVNTELQSVTDNPLVFDGGDFVSGGNFHGQPVAFVMDFLAIAVAEIGSISERRIEKITNPHQSGLPAFATRNSGLNSGFMIPHVVAASLVSENKVLCHPASVDSIPTSADKEDHVSMGPIAARKARSVIINVRNILAIEYLASTQGLDLLAPLKPSTILAVVVNEVRFRAPAMDTDRSLQREIRAVADWLSEDGPAAKLAAAGCQIQ
ncbi:MAG: histidine ammonia-lyase [Deltaproteobacteria bacterium]|nr:histidine ammonia-lyase [Deltaproteobacteria bacterium]